MGLKRLGLHLPRQLSGSPCDKKRQISIHTSILNKRICKLNKKTAESAVSRQTEQKRYQSWKLIVKHDFFGLSITMSSHTYKALIAHQCLLTISKHRLFWIYRVTLDAHLYCSWREGGTSAEGMFHFQRCTPLNIVWQPNPEDHRTKKGIYLLVLSFKCSDDWKIPGWLAQYVNTAH